MTWSFQKCKSVFQRKSLGSSYSKRAIVILSILSMLMLFTNCDNVSQKQSTSANLSSLSATSTCVEGVCYNYSADRLRISSVNNITVNSTADRINVGGECNEGGFPQHLIEWSVQSSVSGSIIVSSNTTNIGDEFTNFQCVNGHFKINVRIPYGLRQDVQDGDSRVPHKLNLAIVGFDQNGQRVEGGAGSVVVNLTPM